MYNTEEFKFIKKTMVRIVKLEDSPAKPTKLRVTTSRKNRIIIEFDRPVSVDTMHDLIGCTVNLEVWKHIKTNQLIASGEDLWLFGI